MDILEIILIAFSLSMDAFAVSIVLGLSLEKPRIKEIVLPGIYFGSFQAFMPLIGYFSGILFADRIKDFDHWIVFLLLGIIGGKMIKDSLSKKEENINKNAYRFLRMLILAVATSIDAMAIGVTFALFKVNILVAVTIIGFFTFFISMIGVTIGNRFGIKYKSKAELIGGCVLILLGIKVLFEHIR